MSGALTAATFSAFDEPVALYEVRAIEATTMAACQDDYGITMVGKAVLKETAGWAAATSWLLATQLAEVLFLLGRDRLSDHRSGSPSR